MQKAKVSYFFSLNSPEETIKFDVYFSRISLTYV